MTYLYMTLAGLFGCAAVLISYWLGVKNTEAIFRAHGLLKPSERGKK